MGHRIVYPPSMDLKGHFLSRMLWRKPIALVLAAAMTCCGSDSPSGVVGDVPPSDEAGSGTIPPGPQPAIECASDGAADLSSLAGSRIAVNTSVGMQVITPSDGSHHGLAGHRFHSWSPDGSYLAAIRNQVETVVLDPALSTITVLPSADISWVSSSDRIGYFIEPNLFTVDLVTGETTQLDVCPDFPELPVSATCFSARWSRSTDWILVNSAIGYTGKAHVLRHDGSLSREYQNGRWSPDGRFLQLAAGGEYDWNFRILDGESRQELLYQNKPVADAGEVSWLRWEGLCHISSLRVPTTGEILRNTWDMCAGGQPVDLPDDLGTGQAAWSADARWITYIAEADSHGTRPFVIYDVQTGARTELCHLTFGEDGAGITFELADLPWSADNRYLLATVADAGERPHLVLISAESGHVVPLAETSDGGHWAP